VGGIKSKVMAAARAGIETVLIPRRNEKDLVEVPAEVLEQLEIIPMDTIDDALEVALEDAAEAQGR
jgi:ATP-dependent Lon protease